jgi:hypothetical protein
MLMLLPWTASAQQTDVDAMGRAIVHQVFACWGFPPPPNAPVVVSVHVELSIDGQIAKPPVAKADTASSTPAPNLGLSYIS